MSNKSIPFTFIWPHTGVSEVFVTGTFDSWSKKIRLDHKNGRFEKTVLLPAEDYIVDGNWVIDTTKETMTDSNGIENNILKKEQLLSSEAYLSKEDSTLADTGPEHEILAVPKDEVALKEEAQRLDMANDTRPSTATSSSSKKSKKRKKKKVSSTREPVKEEAESEISKHISQPTTALHDAPELGTHDNADFSENATEEKITSRPTTARSTEATFDDFEDQSRLSTTQDVVSPDLLSPATDMEDGSIVDGSVNEESVQKVSSRPQTATSTLEIVDGGNVSLLPSKPAPEFTKEDPALITNLGIVEESSTEKLETPIVVDQDVSPPSTADASTAPASEKVVHQLKEPSTIVQAVIQDNPNSNFLENVPIYKDTGTTPLRTSDKIENVFHSSESTTAPVGKPVLDPFDSSSAKQGTTTQTAQETAAQTTSTENLKSFTSQLDNAFSTVKGKKSDEDRRPGSANKDSAVGDSASKRKDDTQEVVSFFKRLRSLCNIL